MNYLHATEVQIYDLPLQSSVPSSQPGFVDIARVECFDACLRAAKVALEYYLGFEPSEYIGFPMSVSINTTTTTSKHPFKPPFSFDVFITDHMEVLPKFFPVHAGALPAFADRRPGLGPSNHPTDGRPDRGAGEGGGALCRRCARRRPQERWP